MLWEVELQGQHVSALHDYAVGVSTKGAVEVLDRLTIERRGTAMNHVILHRYIPAI